MTLPLKRTLGDIRADIQTALGFGMAGQAGIVNSSLIDSKIRSAQEQLYSQFDFVELKEVYERTTGENQSLYDYPPNCNVERINGIWVVWSGQYIQLKEGIDPKMRTYASGNVPARFERRAQIELWPVPNTNEYKLRFEYIRTLDPLTADGHRTTIPSELVYLHALSNCKAHYRQPDAQTYATQLDALLLRIKARHRTTGVYRRTSEHQPTPYDYVTSDQDV